MTTIRDVVSALAITDTGRPRLTWYGPDGERVELSGRVLVNWVTKATNLLVEEAAAGPGTRVVLDLPAHWRAVVWAMAAWTAGAEVVLPEGGPERPLPRDLEGAVVVTDRPEQIATAAEADGATPDLVVAVALPALAMRFPGSLPPRALDGAADLMTYPDALGWLPALDGAAPALDDGPNHGGLLHWASSIVGPDDWPARARVLVRSADDVVLLLAATLAVLLLGGSVVVLGDPRLDVAAVAAAEGVGATT